MIQTRTPRLYPVLTDHTGRPLRRISQRGEMQFTRTINSDSSCQWSGRTDCDDGITSIWNGIMLYEPGWEEPLWAGIITDATGDGIQASDFSYVFTRRSAQSLLVSTSSDRMDIWMEGAILDAKIGGKLPIVLAFWKGQPPQGQPGAPAFAAEMTRGTPISELLSSIVSLGWWWTMDGRWLRVGRYSTCAYGGRMSTARFVDPDSLTDSGPPISQVVAHSQDGGYAAYPSTPNGWPPYHIALLEVPDNLSVYSVQRLAQDAYFARNQQFAVGKAVFRPCDVSLRNLVPGRWFLISAPRGTRLNPGLRGEMASGVSQAEFYPSTLYGIISQVDVTVSNGTVSNVEVTFAAPDQLDPKADLQTVSTLSAVGSVASGVTFVRPPQPTVRVLG